MMNNGSQIISTAEADAQQSILKIQIGGTTYHVGIHFSESSRETMTDKLKHMIKRDVQSRACKEISPV